MDSFSSERNVPGSWEWPESLHARQPASDSSGQSKSTPESAKDHIPQASQQSSRNTQTGAKPRTWKPRQCRICLDTVLPSFSQPLDNVPGVFQPSSRVTYEDENGRLLRPCKCKGSSKYVHEVCLQAWRHADPSYGRRNFYNCPTCGFKYRISRLGIGNMISSISKLYFNRYSDINNNFCLGSQIALTVLIFTVTIFVLGFISDFVIDVCLDPWGSLWRGVTLQGRQPIYYDDLADGPSGWIEHFSKGFASLGLLSFFKAMLASPIQLWRTNVGGGRGRNTGRDRLGGMTWVVIMIGALTFMLVSSFIQAHVVLLTCESRRCGKG